MRTLVVSPMKSGSTYVSNVLTAYAAVPPLAGVLLDLDREHSVDETFANQLRGRAFCMNFHMLPTRFNLLACKRENIVVVGVWRNLGDMLVSLDDHFFREELIHGPAGFPVVNPDTYLRMEETARHRFLIDAVLPWYLGFYLRWRRTGLILHAYEAMVADPFAYFARILQQTFRHEAVSDRLAALLAQPAGNADRFNVGRVGRSAERLAEDNRRRLEELILTHAHREQLEVLLWELPWRSPVLADASPLDGRVVSGTNDSTPLFVTRGVAFPVSPAWLASRFGPRAQVDLVPDDALAALPRGETLF
jgi:hypothetical protein